MKISKYFVGAVAAVLGLFASSCVNDLNVDPTDPNATLKPSTKADLDGYLAALYYDFYTDQGLSLSDGGRGVFTRCHNDLNEITSDELFISEKWQDPGYQVLNKNTWSDTNEWIYAAYSRENHTCKLASTYISTLHEYAPALGYSAAEITELDAEARALRAYAYYQNIDLFGRGPWIDENSVTGVTPPTYDRKQLFEAVIADLTANVENLPLAKDQFYGRISREAGYMILAKLYLNAEVYTGTAMWQECADVLNKIVKSESNIQLAPTYKYLFCASNSKYVGGSGEIIFAFPQQRTSLETWGGTTELTCASYMEADSDDSPLAQKLKELNFPGTPWSGLRMRPELSKALLGETERQLMYIGSYQIDIPDLVAYNESSCGYMLTKYSNSTEDDYYNEKMLALPAEQQSFNGGSQMCSIDLPVFRLADVYLMLAECELNGAKDCNGLALFNLVRQRAGMPTASHLDATTLLKERMVELYAEGMRRSDLIRFHQYTGAAYLWSWKGGDYTGTSIEAFRSVFPIPYQYEITVGQNPGY